jgi:hypothetical protein
VSDDFTWKPDPASRHQTNVAVVLAFVGLGVVASSLYPLKLVMSAFERTRPSRTAANGNTTSPATRAAFLAQAPEKRQPATVEPTEAPPLAGSRMVLLNPGSAEATTPEETTANAPFGRLGSGASSNGRQPPALNMRPSERNVLVVVRRRGPPYDTKILRGRIRDGRLIVDVRSRRGISLH